MRIGKLLSKTVVGGSVEMREYGENKICDDGDHVKHCVKGDGCDNEDFFRDGGEVGNLIFDM